MGYEILVPLARAAVERHLRGESPPDLPTTNDGGWNDPKGVFVTLTTKSGALRGCIGHLQALEKSLVEEVAYCAVAAATEDPRFLPVQERELGNIEFEISVLEPLEPIATPSQLDPQRFGVVVERGNQRGVLLPGIEGVDTAEEQVGIACEKAGIFFSPEVKLYRFEVTKVSEAA